MLLRGVGHAFGPDVKAAVQRYRPRLSGNLPGSPDSFALIEALIKDVVLTDIALVPVALAVLGLVFATDNEFADPVAPFAGHGAAGKAEMQVHPVPAGHTRLDKEAGPRAAGEARISLWRICFGLAHCCLV